MLERRRAARKYNVVPGEDEDEDEEHDVELGVVGQETGSIPASQSPDVTTELDNWDENAEDWDEDEQTDGHGSKTPATTADDEADGKKRSD